MEEMGSNHMHDVFRNSENFKNEGFPEKGKITQHKVEPKIDDFSNTLSGMPLYVTAEKGNTRTRKVPVIDEETGEVNPAYERLTGQPIPNSKKVDKEDIGKFTIPPSYEPKQKNRFLIKFPKEFNIREWTIKSTSRPTYDVVKGEWKNMVIKFYDPTSDSPTKAFYDLINEGLVDKEVVFELHMLGPFGNLVEEWKITGHFNTIDFGELDYSVSELAEVTIVITPSKCELLS